MRVFLEQISPNNGKDNLDVDAQASKLRTYASFMTACWNLFPQFASQQSNNLMEIFSQFSQFFNTHTESGYPLNTINSALLFWNSAAQDIDSQTWQAWDGKDMLPELIPKILKLYGKGSGSKTNELISEFISNKWTTLNILLVKAQHLKLSLPTSLLEDLFSNGVEVLDQANYESLPCVYKFLHTLLFSFTLGNVPLAIASNLEANVEQLLEAAWKSFAECKRKTVPLIASFIGLIFHSVIFHIASEQVRYVTPKYGREG